MKIPLEELDEAAEAGRDVLVRPWADTAVLVRTKNKDHMRQVIQGLQPWEDMPPQVQIVASLFQFSGMLIALDEPGTEEQKRMQRFVKAMHDYFIEGKGDEFYSWASDD